MNNMWSSCRPAISESTFPRSERGQSTLEFIGVLPLLVIAAIAFVQAFLLALTLLFAHASAPTAARIVREESALPTASQLPVPRAWQQRALVTRRGSTGSLRLRTPAAIPGLNSLLPPVTVEFDATGAP